MRGGGDIMVLWGELLVAVSVACELVVVRGGRAWPCWWPVVSCVGCTAPRGVRFPSHGIGLVIALRGGGRAVPPERHRRAWDRRDGALSCGGAGDLFLVLHAGVYLSPDSNNIFSQPQKTPHNARTNEPARVDAPGRANSKAERRAAPARLEKRLSEGKLWPALWFRAIGASRDLARQANSTLI